MSMKYLFPLLALLFCTSDPVSVDFADLSDFDFEEGMTLPAEVRKLDGKTIRIIGFMRSEEDEVDDLEAFIIVNQNCDCEGAVRMNEQIYCILPEGETVSITDEPVKVEGVFEVGEEKEDGYVLSIYRIVVTKLH